MKKFTIEITSPPDRENLVVEIWYNENLIAEVSQESNLEIEFYPFKKFKFGFQEFLDTLELAKNRLKSS